MAVRPIDRPRFPLMAPQVEVDQTIFIAKKIKHKKTCKITFPNLEGNKTATLVSRGFAALAKNLKTDAAADVCEIFAAVVSFMFLTKNVKIETLTFDGTLTATG